MIGRLRRSRDGGACVVAAAGMVVGCSLWPAATGARSPRPATRAEALREQRWSGPGSPGTRSTLRI
jgi:hypothetical protein